MKRSTRVLGVISFVFGILFLLNSNLNFTGAFIGSQNVFSSLNLIYGIAFILISFIIFAFTGRLEDNLTDVEEIEVKRGIPVIIDTNYLIDACKNPMEYKNLMGFIQEKYNHGQKVIVPRSVYNEFKSMSVDEGEKNRIKNLKEILSKFTTTLENVRGEVWENADIKRRSIRQAEEILHQTPKYFAYQFLSEINKGEHITVDRFIGKSRGKMSNAISEGKYEQDIHNARRAYDNIVDKSGHKGKNNLLSGYNVSPADIDVFSGALEVLGGVGGKPLMNVDIITKDSHLIDSSHIFNRLNAGRNKINVKEKV